MNFYTKYRPKGFKDIVGQENIVVTLQKSLKNNSFGHAYFFYGPKGTGKTSLARIFAKELQQNENVLKGQCSDVIEIDAASNRGIDNIKDIIEKANWPPRDNPYKIYIIDECHQLTPEANNALLKILEEPPSYLKFILCTTEKKKTKSFETILSRCIRFTFQKLKTKDIAERLRKISDSEKINVTDCALLELAIMSDGALRDAIVKLEQIASLKLNKEINKEFVLKYFHISDRKFIYEIVNDIINNDLVSLLTKLDLLLLSNVDIVYILQEVSKVFRNILIIKIVKNDLIEKKLINLSQNDVELLKGLSVNVNDAKKLSKLPSQFADAEKALEININNRWVLETTLINCAMFLAD